MKRVYIIDGKRMVLAGIMTHLKARGCDYGPVTIGQRLAKGARTLAELMAPKNAGKFVAGKKGGQVMIANKAASKAEAAAAMAAVDARRKAMRG